jgi:2-hydroxy-3-oxopropionate reductase
MPSRRSSIAFLGIGLMGLPMSKNLLKAGYPLTVWNRTRAKTLPLAERGARVGASPSEAVAGAEVVMMILENGPVVDSVLFGQGTADAIAKGALVIDLSSIPPSTAREHAARLRARGIEHLDAPVSGGPYGAEDATLAIMVGGEPQAFERAAPILSLLGRATLVGPSGSGQVAKLGSQMIVAAAIGAVSEAILLARANGADPARVREALTGGFADSKILRIHAKRMIEREFTPGGHVRTHHKDLGAAVAAAGEHGLDLPIMTLMHDLFGQACAEGRGDLDHAALFLTLEERSRIKPAP